MTCLMLQVFIECITEIESIEKMTDLSLRLLLQRMEYVVAVLIQLLNNWCSSSYS